MACRFGSPLPFLDREETLGSFFADIFLISPIFLTLIICLWPSLFLFFSCVSLFIKRLSPFCLSRLIDRGSGEKPTSTLRFCSTRTISLEAGVPLLPRFPEV